MKHLVKALSFMLCLSTFGTLSYADDMDPNAAALKYRQAQMWLIGMNFGPIVAMAKGEMEWNDDMIKAFAADLDKAASLNGMRGYPVGSHVGKTEAKPEIWENMDEFKSMNDDMIEAAAGLAKAAATGDKKQIMGAFKKTGGTCKACHDDYKAKEYLNQD